MAQVALARAQARQVAALCSAAQPVDQHPLQMLFDYWQQAKAQQDPGATCLHLYTGDSQSGSLPLRSLTAHGLLMTAIKSEHYYSKIHSGADCHFRFAWTSLKLKIDVSGELEEVALPQHCPVWQTQLTPQNELVGLLLKPLQLEISNTYAQDERQTYIKSKRRWLLLNS